MWCPKCKNEFVEGIKICPKCEEPLVDKKTALSSVYDEHNDRLILGGVAEKDYHPEEFIKALEESDIIGEGDYSLVAHKLFEDEKEILNEKAQESGKMKAGKFHILSPPLIFQPASLYQKKSEKADDMKNSAIALILVGVVGMILVILVFTGVISLNQTLYGKIITCSVMGFLFLVLIVLGFLSIKSFKLLKKNASEEDKMTEEIEKWYKESLTKDIIDNNLFTAEERKASDEEKYFKRIAKISSLLNDKFMNLENTYSDHITEDIYSYIFENEN